jgi:Spy/CpxP family protein refolding chaperone
MLTAEWDMDTALDVRYDEGREEGRDERDLQWNSWLDDIGLTPEQKQKLEEKRRQDENRADSN